MKKLNITVFTKDINYANDLARGLCDENAGLVVFVEKDREKAKQSLSEGVLLTDYMDFPQENQIDKLKTVKEILQQAIELHYAKTGELFEIRRSQTKVIGFYALCGGIGTTSLAITYSRFLALKKEKNVLFLNLSVADDYQKYIESYPVFSKKQFVFMCENRLPIDYDKYFIKDKYGVLYFEPEKTYNSFIGELVRKNIVKLLKEQRYFDYIIVDFGKVAESFESDFDAASTEQRAWQGDVEVLYQVTKGRVANPKDILLNGRTEVSKSYMDIPVDVQSFDEFDNYTEISMTGPFGRAVETLVTGE